VLFRRGFDGQSHNTIAGWVLAGGIAALGLSIVSSMIFAERPEQDGLSRSRASKKAAMAAPRWWHRSPPAWPAPTSPRARLRSRSARRATRSPGRRQRHRPESLWHARRADRPGQGRLRLLGRAEGRGRQLGLRQDGRVADQPAQVRPGTKMTFAGLPMRQERAERDRLSQQRRARTCRCRPRRPPPPRLPRAMRPTTRPPPATSRTKRLRPRARPPRIPPPRHRQRRRASRDVPA
jgi:hypothetical protein